MKFPSTPEELKNFFTECGRSLAAPIKRGGDVMLMDYHEQYLRSKKWARIKKRILERDNNDCQSCGGRGTVVHHRSYAREVLEGNDDGKLATVCDGCHYLIHFRIDGARRGDAECDATLVAGQKQTDIPGIKIDLRKRMPEIPEDWFRMTAVQRKIWYDTYARLRHERWLKVNKNRPKPKELGGFFAPSFWLDGYPEGSSLAKAAAGLAEQSD